MMEGIYIVRCHDFELRPVLGFFESRLFNINHQLSRNSCTYIDPLTDEKEAGQVNEIDHAEYYF